MNFCLTVESMAVIYGINNLNFQVKEKFYEIRIGNTCGTTLVFNQQVVTFFQGMCIKSFKLKLLSTNLTAYAS